MMSIFRKTRLPFANDHAPHSEFADNGFARQRPGFLPHLLLALFRLLGSKQSVAFDLHFCVGRQTCAVADVLKQNLTNGSLSHRAAKIYIALFVYIISAICSHVSAQQSQLFLGTGAPYNAFSDGQYYGSYDSLESVQQIIIKNYNSERSRICPGQQNQLVSDIGYYDGAISTYVYYAATTNSDGDTSVCSDWGWVVNSNAFFSTNYVQKNDGENCCLSVGNPINFAAKNKFQEEKDYQVNKWLFVIRYYNSDNSYIGGYFGKKWRLGYQSHIDYQKFLSTDEGSTTEPPTSGTPVESAMMHRPDGKNILFWKQNNQWVSEPQARDVLSELVDGSGNEAGWTYRRDMDNWVENYDVNGLLTSTTDDQGLVTTFSYSDASTSSAVAPTPGLLIKVVDPFGRVINITYDSASRINVIALPGGSEMKYAYSSASTLANQDLLTSVIFPDTSSRSYTYNDGPLMGGDDFDEYYFYGLLTGIYDEYSVKFASFYYDAGQSPIETTHAGGAEDVKITYINSGANNSAVIQYPLGESVKLTYANLSGRLVFASADTPCASACGLTTSSQTYDTNANPEIRTDFDGNVTRTTYAASGLLEQEVDALGAVNQRTISTNWNTGLRLPLVRTVMDANDATVAQSAWVYNYLNEVHVHCEIDPAVPAAAAYTCADTGTPPAGVRRWIYHYCGSVDTIQCPVIGLLLTVDGPRTDVADTTSYVYYMLDGVNHHHGDLKSVTDPLGHVTTYLVYDGAGRVTSMQDANGVYTDFTYTPRGWLQTKTVRVTPDNSPSSSDAITTLGYTAYGAVNSITDPDGVVTTFQYDAAHRLTDIYDALGKHIHYTLDAAGNKTAEQTFPVAGTAVRSLSRTFNALGELTAVEDGLNHTVFSAGYSDSYDANGNLVHSVDGLGYQRYQGFDALNRLTSTIANYNGTDPATQNSTTAIQRDALDRQTQVTDPTGLHTTYSYDGLGDRTQLQSPDTGTSTDTYDAAGNRLTHTDAKGIVSTSTYDADNRLTGTSYADSSLNVSYGYDESNAVTGCTNSRPIDRLTRVVESGVTTIYCYGGHGNISQKKQVTSGHTDVTVYGYTSADRLSSVLAPDGTQVNYSYNSNGLLSGVQVTPSGSSTASTVVSNINWLPFGPMVDYTLGNGQTVTRSYDANYALTDLTSPALSLHFARDVMGDIQALGNTPGANPATETYGYDPLYRLTGVTEASDTALENYTYKQTGDRLSKTATDQVTGGGTYTYTPGTHQLASIGSAARSSDANGNTLTSVMGGNSYGFGYNGRNRLTTAQLNGQTVASYTYNALGERIGKVASFPQAITERYAYNEAGQLIGEYGTTNRDYVWLGDLPVAVIDNTVNGSVTTSTVNYVTADQLGTPRAVSNNAGTVIWSWAYQGNPFGEQQPTSTTGYVLNLRYPGQYYDAETNTNYNMSRNYEPATGRYLQSDPIGLGGGLSTYAYVLSNPLQMTDLLGLCPCPGGTWKQEKFDFGVSVAFGGMLSVNKAIMHCESNPNITVKVRQTSIAGGLIVGGGASWSISGEVFGVPDSKDFEGWSTNQIFASFGPFSDSAPFGPGGSFGAGPSVGAGLAWGSTYTHILKENCPSCDGSK